MSAADDIQRAVSAFQGGDVAVALAGLDAVLERAPDDAEAWLTMGLILIRAGRLPDGLKALRRVSRLSPLDAIAYAELAAAYRLDQDGARAADCDLTARALEDNGAELRRLYQDALVHQSCNDYDSVVADLRPVAAALPACASIHKALADFLHAVAKLDALRGQFTARLRGGAPTRAAMRVDAVETERLYSAAIFHAPDWSEAHTYFANFLHDIGRISEASEHYRLAVHHRPSDPIARFNLARDLEASGDAAAAKVEAEAAIRLFPGLGEAHECLGRLLVSSDPVAAARHFSMALGQARFHTTAANL